MGNDKTIYDNGITYHFSPKVKQKSQKDIHEIFSKIREKSWKNKEFFDGLSINVYGRWEEMDNDVGINYEKTIGFTFDPIWGKPKEINLRTRKYSSEKEGILYSRNMNSSYLEQTAIHELGHIFDYYFADSDPKLTEELRTYTSTLDLESLNQNETVLSLYEKYTKQDGLSDSEEFAKAWQKDLNIAFKGKSKDENEQLLDELDYYSPMFFDSDDCKKITVEDGIDDSEILLGDKARKEIFAQLFSYAMGTGYTEPDKHLIVNTYKYSYEVVKKYINEYLGTNTTGHYIPRNKTLDCEF